MHHATTPTGNAMIVLSRDEYDRLTASAEDAIDAAALDAARAADAGLPALDAETTSAVLAGTLHPLTAWRKAFGLTIADLAARAAIRPATISDVENGKIDPRYGTVKALAEALGLDVDDIMP